MSELLKRVSRLSGKRQGWTSALAPRLSEHGVEKKRRSLEKLSHGSLRSRFCMTMGETDEHPKSVISAGDNSQRMRFYRPGSSEKGILGAFESHYRGMTAGWKAFLQLGRT